jgi:hypothetical protein
MWLSAGGKSLRLLKLRCLVIQWNRLLLHSRSHFLIFESFALSCPNQRNVSFGRLQQQRFQQNEASHLEDLAIGQFFYSDLKDTFADRLRKFLEEPRISVIWPYEWGLGAMTACDNSIEYSRIRERMHLPLFRCSCTTPNLVRREDLSESMYSLRFSAFLITSLLLKRIQVGSLNLSRVLGKKAGRLGLSNARQQIWHAQRRSRKFIAN